MQGACSTRARGLGPRRLGPSSLVDLERDEAVVPCPSRSLCPSARCPGRRCPSCCNDLVALGECFVEGHSPRSAREAAREILLGDDAALDRFVGETPAAVPFPGDRQDPELVVEGFDRCSCLAAVLADEESLGLDGTRLTSASTNTFPSRIGRHSSMSTSRSLAVMRGWRLLRRRGRIPGLVELARCSGRAWSCRRGSRRRCATRVARSAGRRSRTSRCGMRDHARTSAALCVRGRRAPSTPRCRGSITMPLSSARPTCTCPRRAQRTDRGPSRSVKSPVLPYPLLGAQTRSLAGRTTGGGSAER